ncbi:MAG: 3-isopropylmalate dehydrogenase [Chloroflexi bacterium]|nr:3-isopropylmalate dehydrogenase [Chloroflexota bacterium]MBV9595744.1 3-isopropylmalate dehydrogenase [Chloroflexota bacterium]
MTRFRLAVLGGDGIGPEVVAEAVRVLRAIESTTDHRFELTEDLVGGAAIDAHGTALRRETVALARRSDAVIFGAVGGPKWDDPRAAVRPEQAILGLRAALGTFANLRPARMQPALVHLSPLKAEIVQGADVLFIRELVAGTYFARPKKYWQDARGTWRAVDTTAYTEPQVERTVRMAFELARGRRKKVHVADKQNVMATSRLWRDVASRLAADYADVEFQAILTDALAMHLLYRPSAFDVIVTDNLFGDLITDEAAVLAGSMGLMPSASLGSARNRHGGYRGLYEPIHGTAPDIAGKGVANPMAAIQSLALLLRYSLRLEREARAVERAVDDAIELGLRTPDIARPGERTATTTAVGEAVVEAVLRELRS